MVRNLVTLHFPAPIPGTGWGCLVCSLPADGAIAVVCDDCLNEGDGSSDSLLPRLKFVLCGLAYEKKRAPIAKCAVQVPFAHNPVAHALDDELRSRV